MKLKLSNNAKIALLFLVLVVLFCAWAGKKLKDRYWTAEKPKAEKQSSRADSQNPAAPVSNEQAQQIYLALGNPSNAGADPNNYLLINAYFALSYNRAKAIPNWVAWRISRAELGEFPRPNPDPFRPDDRIPKDWKRVTPSDYTGSGFDKGHLCPSADRSASVEGMAATFLMTNMVPQTPDLNREVWNRFEDYLRLLVKRGNDVYIVAGTYGDKGKLKNKVVVPTNNWKIAVVVPADSPISGIDENTRVIAVDMPNVSGIKNEEWQKFSTTVREIEKRTNCNFLSSLPQNLQDKLENKKDND
jgi:endonuclease G, mitochondrial